MFVSQVTRFSGLSCEMVMFVLKYLRGGKLDGGHVWSLKFPCLLLKYCACEVAMLGTEKLRLPLV